MLGTPDEDRTEFSGEAMSRTLTFAHIVIINASEDCFA
jgi:hypothetical protein